MNKKTILIFVIIILTLLIGGFFLFSVKKLTVSPKEPLTFKQLGNMNLTASAFSEGQSIPSKYTCDGENINPELLINEVPPDAKSLVLIVDDPDAPAGTWVHWTLWNIDPQTSVIAENTVPSGAVEGVTSFGKSGYGGPCPPSGTHRYVFKLYALDQELDLPASTTADELPEAMQAHILEQTQLMGTYSRK